MRNFLLSVCLLGACPVITAQTDPIYGIPTGGQAVAQPIIGGTQTTLAVNSLNQVLYVDPASAIDLITQVNALISACGSAPCAIHIPAAATPSGTPAVYAVTSGTINITSTNISIIGDGVGSTVITYSGSNFLNLAEGDSFVLNPVGKIGGFTLQCTASDSSCIKAGSVIGADFEDIDLYGPGGGNRGT